MTERLGLDKTLSIGGRPVAVLIGVSFGLATGWWLFIHGAAANLTQVVTFLSSVAAR